MLDERVSTAAADRGVGVALFPTPDTGHLELVSIPPLRARRRKRDAWTIRSSYTCSHDTVFMSRGLAPAKIPRQEKSVVTSRFRLQCVTSGIGADLPLDESDKMVPFAAGKGTSVLHDRDRKSRPFNMCEF